MTQARGDGKEVEMQDIFKHVLSCAESGAVPVSVAIDALQKLIDRDFGRKEIDLNIIPLADRGYYVADHQRGGRYDFDPAGIALRLPNTHVSVWCAGYYQGTRYSAPTGYEFRETLRTQRVLNANVLDWLLKPENQHFIPEEWKGKQVCFWGTIYGNGKNRSNSDSCYVRSLFHSGRRWCSDYLFLGHKFVPETPAAVFVS